MALRRNGPPSGGCRARKPAHFQPTETRAQARLRPTQTDHFGIRRPRRVQAAAIAVATLPQRLPGFTHTQNRLRPRR